MSLLPVRNYRHNRKIPLPPKTINGQGLGDIAGMRFGLSTVSYSGCEVIAVYNALLLAGRPVPFCEIARYMERFRVLFGFWGTNFLALGRCLGRFGLKARRVRDPKKLRAALDEGKLCLYVYWVGKRFRSMVHTVAIHRTAGGTITVYNAYNNCGHPIQVQPEQYITRRMIFGYITEEDFRG